MYSNSVLLFAHQILFCCLHIEAQTNGLYFPDNIFKYIFLNKNVWISNTISLVPEGPINNIPALVQIMAWCRQAIIRTNDG